MSSKYKNSKLYQVTDINYTECYIGSTTLKLSKRMALHRSGYKKWKNNKGSMFTVFNIFDKFGVQNCKIELIELFPCSSLEELRKREGYYIKTTECVNKVIPSQTKREYRESHKDQIRITSKIYWENHKENYLAIKKREYDNNRAKYLQRSNKRETCLCGMSYTHANKSKHIITRKHINIMKFLDFKAPDPIFIDNYNLQKINLF